MANKGTSDTADGSAGAAVDLSHIAESLRPLAVPVADLTGSSPNNFPLRSLARGLDGRGSVLIW
jgi:hypothetical protein